MKKDFYIMSIALFTAISLSAQTSVWSGGSDVWTKGAGTEASPFLIESADQLSFIAEMVNAGITDYQGKWFRLTKDMDLNHIEWIPIGEHAGHSFKGNLDGNNHTISNIRVSSGEYSGLFGYISHATIKNLTISGDSIVGNYAAGGVSGKCDTCNIVNCVNFCKVNCSVLSYSESTVTNTKNTSTTDSYSGFKTISNYYSISLINGHSDINAGGITGLAIHSNIYECVNHGLIYSMFVSPCSLNYNQESSYSKKNVYYEIEITNYSGGIAGQTRHSNISYCVNKGNIFSSMNIGSFRINGDWGKPNIYSVTGGTPRSGGIAGELAENATVIKSANLSAVTSVNISEQTYGNGIAGYTHGTIEYCYNMGQCVNGIGGATVKNSYNAGQTSNIGISFGNITNCYYLYGTGNGTQKTEAQMKSVTLPILLNTDSTVFIQDANNVNNGYPIFIDQVYAISDRPNSIDFIKAELAGHFYAQNADSVGFEYKALGDNTHWYNSVTVEGENSVSYEIENLSVGTEYTYRLWVEREGIRYYGDTINFKTLECSKEITPLSATICAGEEYAFGEKQLMEEGVYRDTLTAINGCDSIIELTLSVNPSIDIDKKDTIAIGESYDFYGEILTETGDYYHYIPMGNKCNRVVLHLFVESSATRVENIEEISAPKKLVRNGQIYIIRGDKTYTLQGQEVK